MITDDEIDEFYENLEERKSIIKTFIEYPSDDLEDIINGWERDGEEVGFDDC